MYSVRTKAKGYAKSNENYSAKHCIAEIVIMAESDKFRIYVAWEWEDMAKKSVFGFIKSRDLYNFSEITPESIKYTADYGHDITAWDEAKQIFKNIL